MQFQDALGEWSVRPGPLYARLAAAIGEAIGRGDMAPGTALPPERSLARRLAIGRTTVTSAYAQLRQEELVESRQGSGLLAVTVGDHHRYTGHRDMATLTHN
jgi:DNA-binding GntR family transcriptional regulator